MATNPADPADTGLYCVKVKAPQHGCSMFITPRGGLNRLRVHAAQFGSLETAQKTIELNRGTHPDWQWKVVSA